MSNEHWNYRIMRHIHENGEIQFSIHEVYYSDDEVIGWTDNPADMTTFDEDGLPTEAMKKAFSMMQTALDKPILNFDTGEEL
jgi:hypothetical protein